MCAALASEAASTAATSRVARPVRLGEGEVPLSGRVIPMQQAGWGFGMEFGDLEARVQQQLETYYQQHTP